MAGAGQTNRVHVRLSERRGIGVRAERKAMSVPSNTEPVHVWSPGSLSLVKWVAESAIGARAQRGRSTVFCNLQSNNAHQGLTSR